MRRKNKCCDLCGGLILAIQLTPENEINNYPYEWDPYPLADPEVIHYGYRHPHCNKMLNIIMSEGYGD